MATKLSAMAEDRVACEHCCRKFAADRIAKHVDICAQQKERALQRQANKPASAAAPKREASRVKYGYGHQRARAEPGALFSGCAAPAGDDCVVAGLPPLPSLPAPPVVTICPAGAGGSEKAPPPPPPPEYTMAGPIDTSNWVVPGRVIMGAYPGAIQEPEHSAIVRKLVECGAVTTFCCLQEVKELERYTPYRQVARDVAAGRVDPLEGTAHLNKPFPKLQAGVEEDPDSGSAVTCCIFPIPDVSTAPEADMRTYIDAMVALLARPPDAKGRHPVLYLHCWGGHGRSGMVAAALVGKLYGLAAPLALAYVRACHRERRCQGRSGIPGNVPHAVSQVSMVEKLLSEFTGGAGDDNDIVSSAAPPVNSPERWCR